MSRLYLDLEDNGYEIIIGSDILSRADEVFNLNRKVLIITDNGVPEEYAKTVACQCKESCVLTLRQGEGQKSFDGLKTILEKMSNLKMDRHDCVVAVGGGVVGDLAGFASSCYMRGVDFYNVPTTVLSQVDSSVGGKTAINFNGVKNLVGAFYQPKAVLIDVETLKTLPKRQISNGLSEAVKMSLTSNPYLFETFERLSYEQIMENIQDIIEESVTIKMQVVEQDEKETGIRKILNFGHTVGHAIEAQDDLKGLLHGECVALGMLTMCSKEIRERLVKVLEKLELPTKFKGDIQSLSKFIEHDKKSANGFVNTVLVNQVGKYEIVKMDIGQIINNIKEAF